MHVQISLGVDQTGAVLRGGEAWKSLPAALAFQRKDGSVQLQVLKDDRPLTLAAFQRREILRVIEACRRDGLPESKVRVLVDCVLGLPAEITSQNRKRSVLHELFIQAARHHLELARQGGAARGRTPAEDFFAQILTQSGVQGIPTRTCERVAGANSVFKARPYQKNVQTGTYRIWVELGLEALAGDASVSSGEYHFPHHEAAVAPATDQALIQVEESWPSLLWKTLLGAPAREPARLREWLARCSQANARELICSDRDLEFCAAHPDHADALVLALGGILLPEWEGEIPAAHEGWITGLALPL